MPHFFQPVIAIAISFLFLYGLGYGHLEDAGDVARSAFFWFTTSALFIYSARRKWARTLVFVIGIFFALYLILGVGVDYGHPNMSLVASLLETNPDEGLEFLSNLSWRDCLLSILTIGLLCLYRFGNLSKGQSAAQRSFYKSLWCLLIVVNVFGQFAYHCVYAYKKYNKEKVYLNQQLQAVDWNISKINRNPSLKVLVIGESVNKRYMSLMGSPWNTTPFLAGSPQVTAYTQYHSPAPNTVSSLSRTLALSKAIDGSFDLNRNVVALAKAAGYGTLWVSNQRSMGPNDSNVAKMGHQADQNRFLDKMPVVEPAKDDFALLNYLESKLNQPGELALDSVVFLHMIGSHPHACSRVEDMSINLRAGQGRHIDCYLASLQKLDKFMQALTQLLARHAKSYEVLYVSDHSLRVAPMTGVEQIMNDLHLPTRNIYVQPQIQEAYDTPLFFISSAQNKAKRDETPLSGFDFFHLFGNWLGVESSWIQAQKNLQNPTSSAPIQVFDWHKMVPLTSLPDVPPLTP